MRSVTLLGPQVREPNVGAVLAELGVRPPFVSVSAGWQEREGEIDELRAHLGGDVRDLRVYARTEDVYSADRALRLAHRQRQSLLQEMQELYTLRLDHAKDAARELFERRTRPGGDPRVLRAARRQAVAALRRLDRAHLAAIRRVHEDFDGQLQPTGRPAVQQAVAELRREMDAANAVLIAGGHVAVLVNRLRLLGGAELLAGRRVIAWSAGAMAACEAVILFHDHPPQGAANAEVFDAGLGLVRGIVALPHAQSRLALHDEARVALFARRFAPSTCLALDAGACLHFDTSGRLAMHSAAFQLARQGVLSALPPPAAGSG
jgi:peptidase E